MADYSLSDYAAVSKNDGFGGSNAWILILLFAMIFGGGNGFFGNNNYGNVATKEDVYNSVQRSTDFAALERQNNEIMQNTLTTGQNVITAVKDASYNNLGEIRDIQNAVTTGFANQQTCCCETNRNIDSVRYDMANFAAQINSNIDNKFASLEKSQLEQRIAEQAQQITQLQMAQSVCGIPKVSTYAWGTYPYGNCGCNCGNL